MNPKYHRGLTPTNIHFLESDLFYAWAISILYLLGLMYILHPVLNFILIIYFVFELFY